MKVARLRMANQHVTSPRCDTPEDVVRSLGAVQAQDYSQALWAIGLRMQQATVSDVESALQRRTIIRTWGMRGTLHFILAEDAAWMRRLFAPRILAKTTPKVWDYHGTDAAMMARARELFIAALGDGHTLRRDEMINLLKQDGIPDDKQQSYFIFAHLCHTGLLCVGPNEGGKQTFALLEEWAPHQRELSQLESLAELAHRFFASHGPATLADFANWSGLAMTEARAGLDAVSDRLVKESIDSVDYWLSPESAVGAGHFLLPAYDELAIGYKDRSASFQRYGTVAISTYNGMFFPMMVADGQIAGLWKRTIQKTKVVVELRPLESVDPAAFEADAERLGAFLNLPVTVKRGTAPERTMQEAKWGRGSKASPS